MAIHEIIHRVRIELIESFDRLDDYFDLPEETRSIKPSSDGWCIDEILEHITLTNHFLMITLKQSLEKVLRRTQEHPIPEVASRLDRIKVISDPDAFGWIRPEHMEPTRQVSSDDVQRKLHTQREECLNILSQIENGEGSLHKVRMSVQELGKLDMYEWLYFLIQHAKRHCIEMDRICE